MSDDFFDNIDAKLGEQKDKRVAQDDAAEANRAFIKGLIPRLVTIAEGYAAKCNERGMSADVSHHNYSITFTLRYCNGQKRSLVGGSHHDMRGRLAFEDHYPDNDGKRYKSLPTDWYDESNWSDDRYEAKLKKTIEDFVFYADRFGGIGAPGQ